MENVESLILTYEADQDKEYCTDGSGCNSILACKRSEMFCERGYAYPEECTEDIEARELELLGKVLLYGENELFEGKDQERILTAETREGANCDDERADEGGEKPGECSSRKYLMSDRRRLLEDTTSFPRRFARTG